MREIYLGNGQTTFVNPDKNNTKEFDWDTLTQMVLDHDTVMAGMLEDWDWTSSTITLKDIDAKTIAGISSSDWATPCYSLDEGETFIDCYTKKEQEC